MTINHVATPYNRLILLKMAIGMDKIVVFLFILVWSYQSSHASPDYYILLNGLNFDSNAQSMVDDDSTVQLNFFNDTSNYLNGTITLVQFIPPEAFVQLRGYEAAGTDGNTYQTTPTIDKSANFCEYLENDTLVVPDLLHCSNIPPKCPVVMGPYEFQNCQFNGNSMPDHMPGKEKWKFCVSMFDSNQTATAKLLGEACAYIAFPLKSRKGAGK